MLGEMRGIKPVSIKEVSQRHHSLARCLASGMTMAEASLATGYSPSRISILQQDELFQNLLKFYEEKGVDLFAATTEQIAGLTTEAITTLRQRLEDDPDKVSTKDLIAAAQLAADRSGHGPQSTNVNIDVSLSERMKNARARLDAVEGEVVG